MIPTLKRDQHCPACDGRVAIHVEKILETDLNGSNKAIAVAHRPRAWNNLPPVGHFEAYVFAEDGRTRGVRIVQGREG